MNEGDLRELVDQAQTAILTMQSTIKVRDVMGWIDGDLDGIVVDDARRVALLLNVHPFLVPSAFASKTWVRGINNRCQKRTIIGKGR